jgi:8-oxo-dGTP pyrophosphatase MutT (NUDIX family)
MLSILIFTGLIDDHETPEEAAVRELYEETGYTGTVTNCSCLLVSDPGMTNATMKLVYFTLSHSKGHCSSRFRRPKKSQCDAPF